MAAVRMKANRRFEYAAKVLEAGAEFNADNEGDAQVLAIAGLASRETEAPPQEMKRRYQRRDMRAAK
jgi:hypothetical protein